MSMSLHNFLNLIWSLRLTSSSTPPLTKLSITGNKTYKVQTQLNENIPRKQLSAQYFRDIRDFKIQNLVKSHQNSVPGWTEQGLFTVCCRPTFLTLWSVKRHHQCLDWMRVPLNSSCPTITFAAAWSSMNLWWLNMSCCVKTHLFLGFSATSRWSARSRFLFLQNYKYNVVDQLLYKEVKVHTDTDRACASSAVTCNLHFSWHNDRGLLHSSNLT